MAAEELDRQKTVECAMLSKRIRCMVADMPPIETERDKLKRKLMGRFGKRKEKMVISAPDIPKERTLDRKTKKLERDLER